MKSKNSSDSKHLLSILRVTVLSLAAWAVEESRKSFDSNAVNDFLFVLAEYNRPEQVFVKHTSGIDVPGESLSTYDIFFSKNYRDLFAKSNSM